MILPNCLPNLAFLVTFAFLSPCALYACRGVRMPGGVGAFGAIPSGRPDWDCRSWEASAKVDCTNGNGSGGVTKTNDDASLSNRNYLKMGANRECYGT